MTLNKIYLVMHGGGEYESQWDAPLRAFRSKEKALKFLEQEKIKHEVEKKYCTIARKAVLTVPRSRGYGDLFRWTTDANKAICDALEAEKISEADVNQYLITWATFTDIIFWIDEIEYDKSR